MLSPPLITSNSSRRFCDQADSSCPSTSGRSSPHDCVSIRPASTPWLTRYCLAACARRLPSARLYSSEPRSSQCPPTRLRKSALGVGCAGGGLPPHDEAAVAAAARPITRSNDTDFILSLRSGGGRRSLRKPWRPSRQPRAALL